MVAFRPAGPCLTLFVTSSVTRRRAVSSSCWGMPSATKATASRAALGRLAVCRDLASKLCRCPRLALDGVAFFLDSLEHSHQCSCLLGADVAALGAVVDQRPCLCKEITALLGADRVPFASGAAEVDRGELAHRRLLLGHEVFGEQHRRDGDSEPGRNQAPTVGSRLRRLHLPQPVGRPCDVELPGRLCLADTQLFAAALEPLGERDDVLRLRHRSAVSDGR